MYTADAGNMNSCAYTAHLEECRCNTRLKIACTYCVRNFGPTKVDMKVAIGHPRDLVHLAKRLHIKDEMDGNLGECGTYLTPSLHGVQTYDIV